MHRWFAIEMMLNYKKIG